MSLYGNGFCCISKRINGILPCEERSGAMGIYRKAAHIFNDFIRLFERFGLMGSYRCVPLPLLIGNRNL